MQWPSLPAWMQMPALSAIDRKALLLAAAAAGASGSVAAVVVVQKRRRRRQRLALEVEQQQQQEEEQEQQRQQQLVTAPSSEGRNNDRVTSLEQLRELEARSAVVRVLFAAPVLSVAVTQQGAKLAAFPAALCTLRGLKELDLSGNAITEVPATIGRLTALTRLNLARNAIAELPEEVGELWSLVDLDVASNRLTSLPASIGALKHLRFLNAMSNQLGSLPDSIGGLVSLYRCGLKNNRLVALPPSIGALTSLVELYLTDNLLESLPAEMGNMQSLVKLQASFNRLKSLPPELGRLPHLEMVRVASCEIGEVPAALRDAPKLAWMSLASNPCCRCLSPRKLPVVELKDLDLGPKLGDGASGEVFAAAWMGRRVAVKIFVAERSPDGHSRDEMAVAFTVSEPHLVRVLAQLAQPLGLVMEFAEGQPIAEKPNLQSLLRCRWAPHQTFQLGWLLRVAIGVAAALEHMHYKGIAHGDVYAHNVMADDSGHATLCDYGASFPYHKGGPVPYEAQEVRAFGLMLADMVQRLDITFKGMEELLDCQRDLLALVQQCCGAPPTKRPTFGAVGRRLRSIQKSAARAGIASVSPRGDASGLFTPRSCVTEFSFTPRSSYDRALGTPARHR